MSRSVPIFFVAIALFILILPNKLLSIESNTNQFKRENEINFTQTDETPKPLGVQPPEQARRLAVVSPSPQPSATSESATSPVVNGSGVFNSVAIRIGAIPARRNWDRVLSDHADVLLEGACSDRVLCATKFVQALRDIRSAAAEQSALAAVRTINRRVNGALSYRSDQANYGRGDHWASMAEMARRSSGDCEEFAIAKMWLLRSIGVSHEAIQFVVLKDTQRNLHHAVLTVRVDGKVYVLDNLANAVKVDSAIDNYRPIYSFTEKTSYIHGFKGQPIEAATITAIQPGGGLDFQP